MCETGWSGEACNTPLCPVGLGAGLCSGHGLCQKAPEGFNYSHTCSCDDYWVAGPRRNCDTPMCPKACSGHGTCVKSSCVCEDGWTGADCATTISNLTTIELINNHAAVEIVQAMKDASAGGETAAAATIVCKHGGVLRDGACLCAQGWAGHDCNVHRSQQEQLAFDDLDDVIGL